MAVWYLGQATIRIIGTHTWQPANGYSLPGTDFTGAEITDLNATGEFNTTAPVGPRIGSAVDPRQANPYPQYVSEDEIFDPGSLVRQAIGTAGGSPTVVDTASIRVSELGLNIKHPDFGAVGNGTADDTNAIKLAMARVSTSGSVLRSAPLIIPPGRYRITDTLLFDATAPRLQGTGSWSNPASGQPVSAQASMLVWDGGNAPMIKVRGTFGTRIESLMLIGNALPEKRPTALIEMEVLSGDIFKNSFAYFNHLVLGKLSGLGFAVGDMVADRGIYWNSTAVNAQNDSSYGDQLRFDGCTTGWETTGTQSVLHGLRGCQFWYSGTAIKTVSDLQLENIYCARSSVMDLNLASGARVHARYFCSELAGQFASLVGSGTTLSVEGGYWQISSQTRGDRYVMRGVDDSSQVIRLKDFQFTANPDWTTPQLKPIIQFKPATNSVVAQKFLDLNNVRWAVAAPNAGVDESMLDVVTQPGTASTVTVQGSIQAPTSGTADFTRRSFYMTLKNGQQPSFYRDDRAQTRIATGRRVPVRGSTASLRGLPDGTEYCTPVEVPAGQPITALSVNVTTASGSVRFGIRESDDFGLPTTAITDLGLISTAVTGDASLTLATPYVAKSRRTWLSMKAEGGAPTVTGVNGPVVGVELSTSAMSTSPFACFQQSGGTAGLFLAVAPISSGAAVAPLASLTLG